MSTLTGNTRFRTNRKKEILLEVEIEYNGYDFPVYRNWRLATVEDITGTLLNIPIGVNWNAHKAK